MRWTQWMQLSAASSLVAVVMVACGSGGSTPMPSGPHGAGANNPPGSSAQSLTYFHDIKPIVDAKCTGCHVKGGLAPFPLVTVDDVTGHAPLMRQATASRLMPPWLAAPGCQTYIGDSSLTDAQIATIGQWADMGAPAGDPSNVGASLAGDPTALSRVDSTLTMPVSYTPQISPDDYHCFILDWPETATKYVTGFRARAGNAAIVHHAIAFLAPPSAVASYQQLDANEAGPGYTCFGGPGGAQLGGASWLGAWAPGNTGGNFPEGTGIRVDAGSKIILQVHYNTLNGAGQDQTSVDLKLDDTVAKQAAIVPYTNPQWVQGTGMQIPPGNPDVDYSWSFDLSPYMSLVTNGVIPNNSPFIIYSAALHMHLLGTNATTSITPAGGGADECLLNIPQWNFHWQRMYDFTQPVTYHPGDKLNIDCHWNNSQANQPSVNGQQLPPHMVSWGEGTTDEMCLGLMYVSAP